MIFVFFFPSDFPRRHVGLKLFDSLSICFTVDLRWMVGKPVIALQQQDFHSILQCSLHSIEQVATHIVTLKGGDD